MQPFAKARVALAAWRELKGKSGFQARGDALAAALESFLPTYRVVETRAEDGRIWLEIAAEGLEGRAAAQQWIADVDPAARRMFHLEAEPYE